MMIVDGPLTLQETLTSITHQTMLVFYSTGAETIDSVPLPGKASVMLGPEGGFSPGELRDLDLAGAHLVALGSLILRTETAAPVATTLTLHRMGYF